MKRPVIIADIISAIVLLLLLYTAFSKIVDYKNFRQALSASPLLQPFAGTIAWILPVAEIGVAALLFFPATRLKGLNISFILLSILTLYLIYMILFTPELPCNCGGVLKNLTWPQHIIFNLFFIGLSAAGIAAYNKHKETMKQTPP